MPADIQRAGNRGIPEGKTMKRKFIRYDDLRKIMVNTQKPPIPILTNEIKLPDNPKKILDAEEIG